MMEGSRLHKVSRAAGLACGVLISAACGDDLASTATVAQPVLHGRRAEDCEWPAVAALGTCSGVLVHPRVVVYAAHCGSSMEEVRFGGDANNPILTVATSFCRALPASQLGDGSDLAACVLAEPAEGIEPARILAGCELAALQEGAAVTMVGFGADGPHGVFGTQRTGVSTIASVGDELLLDSRGVDTCHGDSGGPLFLEYEEPDGTVAPRVVGITSAGTSTECGTGMSHYVNLTRKLSWLEEATGADVTPCFEGSGWAPNPQCRALVPRPTQGPSGEKGGDPPRCEGPAEAALLETCGDPFHRPSDHKAPSLSLISPKIKALEQEIGPEEGYIEFKLRAKATDGGWGVRAVSFTLLGENGSEEFERVDEIPPYEIPVFRVPPGRFTLKIRAQDHAGNTQSKQAKVRVTTAPAPARAQGCRLGPADPCGASWMMLLALLTGARVATSGGGFSKRRRPQNTSPRLQAGTPPR